MTTSGKTIAKNAGVMMASQIITWALALLLAVFLPRYLGPVAVGELSIAFAIWTLASVLLSFGTDIFLTKEIAVNSSKTADLVMTNIAMRSLLFVLCSVLVVVFVLIMHYSAGMALIVGIIGVSTYFGHLSGSLGAALSGLERMEYISVANIASKIVLTGGSLLLLFLGLNVYWIGLVQVVSSLVSAIILAYSVNRYVKFRFYVKLSQIWLMMRQGSPYLISGMMLMAYQQVDKLFISAMVTTEAVGWYGTAMNLFGTLMFVPVVIGTVLFPTLSRAYSTGGEYLAVMARRSFDLIFLLSIPIGLGLTIIAEPLVQLVYGEAFAPAGDVLAVLGIVLILTYLNTVLGQLIIVANLLVKWNWVIIAAVFLTLPLDLLLVPWAQQIFGNGALGGTLSFAITELLMVICAILILPKNTLSRRNVRTAALSVLSGGIMVLVCLGLRENYILLVIPLGAITYISLVLALRVLSPDELSLLQEGGAKVLARVRGKKQSTAGISSD